MQVIRHAFCLLMLCQIKLIGSNVSTIIIFLIRFTAPIICQARHSRSFAPEVVDVIKLFMNLDLALTQEKQQKQAILRTVFITLLFKNTIVIAVQCGIRHQNIFFDFLILGKSRFPPKQFYNIDYRPHIHRLSHTLTLLHITFHTYTHTHPHTPKHTQTHLDKYNSCRTTTSHSIVHALCAFQKSSHRERSKQMYTIKRFHKFTQNKFNLFYFISFDDQRKQHSL